MSWLFAQCVEEHCLCTHQIVTIRIMTSVTWSWTRWSPFLGSANCWEALEGGWWDNLLLGTRGSSQNGDGTSEMIVISIDVRLMIDMLMHMKTTTTDIPHEMTNQY